MICKTCETEMQCIYDENRCNCSEMKEIHKHTTFFCDICQDEVSNMKVNKKFNNFLTALKAAQATISANTI